MKISEEFKQFTMCATLSVALTFLIVHPGLFAPVHAHVEQNNGRPMKASKVMTARAHYITYFSSGCSGRHTHRSLYVSDNFSLFKKMRDNNEYGYKTITRIVDHTLDQNTIVDDILEISECQNMCVTYRDQYLKCLALQLGLEDATVTAGYIAAGTLGWAQLISGIATAAGVVTFISSWLVKQRCAKNKPDDGQCPEIIYSNNE